MDLWIHLLSDKSTLTLRWSKVPSHTTVIIFWQPPADQVARKGWFSSPIYHVISLPDRRDISLGLPFTSTAKIHGYH